MPTIDKTRIDKAWPAKGLATEVRKITTLPTLTAALSKVGVRTVSDLLALKPHEIVTLDGIGVKRYKKVIAMQVELRAYIVTQKRLQFRRKSTPKEPQPK